MLPDYLMPMLLRRPIQGRGSAGSLGTTVVASRAETEASGFKYDVADSNFDGGLNMTLAFVMKLNTWPLSPISTQLIIDNGTGSEGFSFYTFSNDLRFQVKDGGGASQFVKVYTLSEADVGKLMHIIVARRDSDESLRSRVVVGGAETASSDSSGTGYTAPTGSTRFSVHRRGSASNLGALDFDIYGVSIDSSNAATYTEMTQWLEDCQTAENFMAPLPTAGVEATWRQSDWSGPGNDLLDTSSTYTLTEEGTLTRYVEGKKYSYSDSYRGKVIDTSSADLQAYWPLIESSGAIAENAEGTASLDGTYSSVVLDSSTFQNGDPVGRWDGSSDWCNIYSSELDTRFSPSEGTMSVWLKVASPSVWTDGFKRQGYIIAADGNNYVQMYKKSAPDDQFEFIYKAGGTTTSVIKTSFSPDDWFHVAITWNVAQDRVRVYFDGVQEGSDQSGLGTWAGALSSNLCAIGVTSTSTGAETWNGYIYSASLWDVELTPAQITNLATV